MVPAAALDAVLRGYWAAVTLLCCAAFAAPRGRRAQRTWHMLVCPRATYASRCSGLRALLTSCAARGKLVSSQPSAAAPRWLWRAIHVRARVCLPQVAHALTRRLTTSAARAAQLVRALLCPGLRLQRRVERCRCCVRRASLSRSGRLPLRRRSVAATAHVSAAARASSWCVLRLLQRTHAAVSFAALTVATLAADSRGSLLAQLLFQLHVLRRLAERRAFLLRLARACSRPHACIVVRSARGVRHSSGALMHAGGYLFGA